MLHREPGLAEVRDRVHFPQFTTAYPPISQLVFSLAYAATPSSDVVQTYVRTMKLFVVAFDMGSALVMGWLLCIAGKHVGWVIAYGWSPLVLKEFANSGHLDVIAVFFMLAAICCIVRLSGVPKSAFTRLLDQHYSRSSWHRYLQVMCLPNQVFAVLLFGFAS